MKQCRRRKWQRWGFFTSLIIWGILNGKDLFKTETCFSLWNTNSYWLKRNVHDQFQTPIQDYFNWNSEFTVLIFKHLLRINIFEPAIFHLSNTQQINEIWTSHWIIQEMIQKFLMKIKLFQRLCFGVHSKC